MVGYSYGLGDGVYFDWNDPVSGALPPTEARAASPTDLSPYGSSQSGIANAGKARVTQAARDAAAKWAKLNSRSQQAANIRRGACDTAPIVQAFAEFERDILASQQSEPVALLFESKAGDVEVGLYRRGAGLLTDADRGAGWTETPLYAKAKGENQ